jgi:hypothetical protein
MAREVSIKVTRDVVSYLEEWVFPHPCFEPERCYWSKEGYFMGNSDAYEEDILSGNIFEYIDFLVGKFEIKAQE